jgi:bacterioferritin-associated ferredoxin
VENERHFDPVQQGFLDRFQSVARVSLESLENAVFPFASSRGLKYLWPCITNGPPDFMIVCSCNVLSDHDVRNAVGAAEQLPRNAKQIYGCLGCSAECGRCARTIKTIIDEALGACAQACCSGCPHSRAGTHQHSNTEFALAAS